MAESKRSDDMRAESKLGKFMDIFFYSKLTDSRGESVTYIRKTDRESQLKGIDIELLIGGKKLRIDEKAAIYYSNIMIPTFAFEINFIPEGHECPVDGWLISEKLSTDYYMLIWPNVKCEQQNGQWIRKDVKCLDVADFTIIEAMLVRKARLIIELEHHGCGRRRLLEYAKLLREKRMDMEKAEIKLSNDIKIMYSGQLKEKPVNIIVGKNC